MYQAAGKTCDQLPDVLKKFYFPPLYHERKVLDYIEKNSDDHEGCPAAGKLYPLLLISNMLNEYQKWLIDSVNIKDSYQ